MAMVATKATEVTDKGDLGTMTILLATRFMHVIHSVHRPRFWCSSKRTWAMLCSSRTSAPMGVPLYD